VSTGDSTPQNFERGGELRVEPQLSILGLLLVTLLPVLVLLVFSGLSIAGQLVVAHPAFVRAVGDLPPDGGAKGQHRDGRTEPTVRPYRAGWSG
jgi:hypothetical protein